ncbi:MAG: glycyl radical protein [Bacteroidales bacterium]|nr:glycyl radical protein [Bacteroidales bacterium]
MNKRIQKLRQQSLEAKPSISAERAILLTDFYQSGMGDGYSIPEQRALVFKYIMQNKKICINTGELIVAERGPEPKATPTYPEVSLHSVDDLQMLNTRPKLKYIVDKEVIDIYDKLIIPFWAKKAMRYKIFNEMDENWLNSYSAGIFTEFQEQRAPGHTVLGDKIYKYGLKDIIQQIEKQIELVDFHEDKDALSKLQQLRAMKISAEALIIFANRHAEELLYLAENSTITDEKNELLELAQICRNVPENAPETFHEAIQYYWFVHVGVITEVNPWDSFNPGRFDQHLLPFYQKDIAEGRLTKEKAIEILQSFWIKFNNHPAPPKMGVTAKESNTYTDFALINLGGLKPDGSDAANELTYIILDVIEEMRLLQPSSMVQVSKKNPDRLIKRALKIIKTGYGQPSVFNTDAIFQQLVRQGKNVVDARNGGASGCIETGAFGTERYILTGYFNLTKILELTMNNGFDKRTNKQLGLKTGNLEDFNSFDDFKKAFEKQINFFIDIKLKGNNIIEKMFSDYIPVPFLSLFIDDCITNAKDYNSGGARYNTSYVQGVGLGSVTDNLSSLKYNFFDENKVSAEKLKLAIEANFEGFDEVRHLFLNKTPKFGNDDDKVDDIAVQVFEMFYKAVDNKPTSTGGRFRINLLPTTSHVYFGSVIGAMIDGRKAGMPLSEGISPVQGADRNGPTAVIKTVSKIDHLRTGGTLLNQRFSPDFFEDEEAINKLTSLVRTYFRMDGHHIQFNVVSSETLKKAKKHPEQFQDLIVRVAGYSDYFVDLTEELQDEIIRRNEHKVI